MSRQEPRVPELARLEASAAVLHWAEESLRRARADFDAALIAAYRVEDTPARLAKIAGVSRATVYVALKASGIRFRKPPPELTDARSRGGVSQRERVETALRARVARMADGDRLPAARDLAAELGEPYPTVAMVIKKLADEGIVTARHGVGTWKTRP